MANPKSTTLIFLMLSSVFSFAQSKKDIIESLNFRIDSIKNVLSQERDSNRINSNLLNAKIISFEKEIKLLKEKTEEVEKTNKELFKENENLKKEVAQLKIQKSDLELAIKNLTPLVWKISAVNKNTETGEIQYKFTLAKGEVEIISLFNWCSVDNEDPQINDLKVGWTVVDTYYEYFAKVNSNDEIIVEYNLYGYDVNTDSKVKYNQWVRTFNQLEDKTWKLVNCKGKCN